MKKIVLALLLFCLTFFLSACDSKISLSEVLKKNDKTASVKSSDGLDLAQLEGRDVQPADAGNSPQTDTIVDNMSNTSSEAMSYSQGQVKIIEQRLNISGVNSYISSTTAKHDKLSQVDIAVSQNASSATSSIMVQVPYNATASTLASGTTQVADGKTDNLIIDNNPLSPNFGIPMPINPSANLTAPVGAGPQNASSSVNNYQGIYTPATAFCLEHGGKPKDYYTSQGDYVMCEFDDGTECEEWKYYYGQCSPGQN